MSPRILATSLGLMGSTILAGYLILRKANKSLVLARIPVLIECLLIFFYAGFFELPRALPSLFEFLLGHSIYAEYVYPVRPDGIRITETWLSARWWTPVRNIYFAAVVVGIAWAIANEPQVYICPQFAFLFAFRRFTYLEPQTVLVKMVPFRHPCRFR